MNNIFVIMPLNHYVVIMLIYHDNTYGTAKTLAESESHIRIPWASCGVSIVMILEKADRATTAPHIPLHYATK